MDRTRERVVERMTDLQTQAAELWSGLIALAALTRRIEDIQTGASNEAVPPPEPQWGCRSLAAAALAAKMAKDMDALVCGLDPLFLNSRDTQQAGAR